MCVNIFLSVCYRDSLSVFTLRARAACDFIRTTEFTGFKMKIQSRILYVRDSV